jgi:hypothetical protein
LGLCFGAGGAFFQRLDVRVVAGDDKFKPHGWRDRAMKSGGGVADEHGCSLLVSEFRCFEGWWSGI